MPKRPDLSPLTGCEVTQVRLDYQVNLLLAAWQEDGTERVEATLTLGTPFILTLANAETVAVEPETGAGYGDVPTLLRRRVSEASADGREALTVHFDDGSCLVIEPSTHYESWALSGEGVQGWLVGPM